MFLLLPEVAKPNEFINVNLYYIMQEYNILQGFILQKLIFNGQLESLPCHKPLILYLLFILMNL